MGQHKRSRLLGESTLFGLLLLLLVPGEVICAQAARMLNNGPRKCLGYRTPHEVLARSAGVALQN